LPIYNTIKKRVYEIIEKGKHGDKASRLFDIFIVALIMMNVIAIILESVAEINRHFYWLFKSFEIFSIIVFSIEYILRIWTSKLKTGSNNAVVAFFKYIISPMAIIDLLAVLPFYLPFLIPLDLRFLRILRVTRLLRIFKIQRYTKSLNLIGKVLKSKKEELFITVFVTIILIIFASTLMYYIENDVQPNAFPNILATFWWAVATLTTIGYGDVYPVTDLGRLLSGIIAVLGIGLVALPTGLISSGFIEEISKKKRQSKQIGEIIFCPHCGKRIHE
jgi:voltage-gated potassium channel